MMDRLLKLYSFAVFISVVSTFQSTKSGDYVLVLESVDNFPNASREFVDWHLSLKRIGKSDKVIVGDYQVKKDIVNPHVEVETYFLSHSVFLKVDLNIPKIKICDNSTMAFLEEYSEGNSTMTEDCVLKPGYMRVKKDKPLDMNKIAHTVYKKVFYGTFKFLTKVVDEAGNIVVQFAWTVTTLSKD